MPRKKKKNGLGFINPPYQNSRTNYPVQQPQKKVVLPVFHPVVRRGG